jgi:hypothetical protein
VTLTLIVAGFLLLALLVLLSSRTPPASNVGILQRFDLDPNQYVLMAADVGGYSKKIRLAANGVHGDPDALIRARQGDELIVGEVKSRAYKGTVRPYERYQLTLYLGAARRRYPRRQIHGLICYSNRVVRLEYDDVLYRRLIALLPEYRKVARRLQTN